jgi:hypothetical protein
MRRKVMKTNRSYTMVRNLVLALAGTLICSGLASAQAAVGKFTLPFEAHWGLATLPAGDYEFTMDSVKSPVMIEVFRGTKGVALVSTSERSTVSAGPAALTIVQTRDGNRVRDLRLPEIGVVLHYAPHKPGKASAAAEREIAQVVPITVPGK